MKRVDLKIDEITKLRKGKYDPFIEQFIRSGEKERVWEVENKSKCQSVATGFKKYIEVRKLSNIVVHCLGNYRYVALERK